MSHNTMNKAMLGNWKLENEEGWWQDILRTKYLENKPMSALTFKPGNSHFWVGLMEVKDDFYIFCTKIVGNGRNTLF